MQVQLLPNIVSNNNNGDGIGDDETMAFCCKRISLNCTIGKLGTGNRTIENGTVCELIGHKSGINNLSENIFRII
jgi:hypothetical protein